MSSTKILVTNLGRLRTKYGAGFSVIQSALDVLIAADQARGLTTIVLGVDDASDMRAAGGTRVTDATDYRANKAAVDALFQKHEPDYLVLLGAKDVIPHQDLENPLPGGPDGDPDPMLWSDLPYACNEPYSRQAKDFIGATRVVGRVPDLVEGSDPAYLAGLLKVAAGWKARPTSDYASYFALTAKSWRESTARSVRHIYQKTRVSLQFVPPRGPDWATTLLARRMHYLNCHGFSTRPFFKGQFRSEHPLAHESERVPARLTEGTIVASEACFGAELYDPSHPRAEGKMGICSAYLKGGAYGFFGSTTTCYGPPDHNEFGDLICQEFMRLVLAGASLGRAAIEARHFLVNPDSSSELDPIDLKTIAQFNLLGDPSVHCVQTSTPIVGDPVIAGALPEALLAHLQRRAERRRQLMEAGLRIRATKPVAARAAIPVPPAVSAEVERLRRNYKLQPGEVVPFGTDRPSRSNLFVSFCRRRDRLDPDEPANLTAFVVRTSEGRIVSARRVVSR